MKAFSMGYTPGIIEIKEGDDFKINVSNLDIMHSFDIDELGIHLILYSSGNRIISIKGIKKGEYEYYCAIPGHREGGMVGKIIVK